MNPRLETGQTFIQFKEEIMPTKTKKQDLMSAIKSSPTTQRKFDAFPDRIDLRDWPYQPTLASLPDELVNCGGVPEILDQGREGACTGFALAGVINYLLAKRGLGRRVSPRMLYEMARCYDEWPGEKYEGSSARGAMKGWARHGVCEQKQWPASLQGRGKLTSDIIKAALGTPCGAFYRVKQKEVRDVHAALNEVGAVYCTIMVHDGWNEPGPVSVSIGKGKNKLKLPVISRRGRADAGHAIVLVGYTQQGFIIQNSWGKGWGAKGFALLPYEDFLIHVTDVWVAQLGVPLAVDLWSAEGGTDSTGGRYRGNQKIPLSEIRPFVVDIGNNGELSQTGDYWTSKDDLKRLFTETIPQKTQQLGWTKKRVMLYLHGGLNGEAAVAKRILAFRDVFIKNEIYPLHIMWETGPLETLADIMGDIFTDADERAGRGLLDGIKNAKDRVLELTTAPIGGPMWSEMKENAWRASDHRKDLGGMQLIQQYAAAALSGLSAAERDTWELHVVAHSAGSIFTAHAVKHLCGLGIPFRTLQFLAPAVRIDDFQDLMRSYIENGKCPKPRLYILSDKQEEDDTVGPYGRSLLWLVSRAFEDKRDTPILGMKCFLDKHPALNGLLADLIISPSTGKPGKESVSKTHGGFDNDPATMNSVLYRILGQEPIKKFEQRDLVY
jgi:C1A family cysteine protease